MPYISQHHRHFLALLVYEHVNKLSAKAATCDGARYNLSVSLEVNSDLMTVVMTNMTVKLW